MEGYVIRDFLMKDRVAGLNLLFCEWRQGTG